MRVIQISYYHRSWGGETVDAKCTCVKHSAHIWSELGDQERITEVYKMLINQC